MLSDHQLGTLHQNDHLIKYHTQIMIHIDILIWLLFLKKFPLFFWFVHCTVYNAESGLPHIIRIYY